MVLLASIIPYLLLPSLRLAWRRNDFIALPQSERAKSRWMREKIDIRRPRYLKILWKKKEKKVLLSQE